jgi:hypothetical protein
LEKWPRLLDRRQASKPTIARKPALTDARVLCGLSARAWLGAAEAPANGVDRHFPNRDFDDYGGGVFLALCCDPGGAALCFHQLPAVGLKLALLLLLIICGTTLWRTTRFH